MANLQFISNVNHNGMIFKGQQIKDNKVIAEGMIVNLEGDTRGLKEVAQSLIDRKLARYTDEPATHTTNFVNGSQEALPVDAPAGSGSAPSADVIRQREALKSAQAPAQAAAPAQPQAPAAPKQPSPEEVAATAAAVN